MICRYNSGTNTVGVTNHCLIRFKAHSKPQDPCLMPDTVRMAKNLETK